MVQQFKTLQSSGSRDHMSSQPTNQKQPPDPGGRGELNRSLLSLTSQQHLEERGHQQKAVGHLVTEQREADTAVIFDQVG
jgi:hypothetical protein